MLIVELMPAHKYLGLTKEILKSESQLNKLVSHPLPSEFYTGGGMNALRARFSPSPRRHSQAAEEMTSPPSNGKDTKDYFNFVPVSPTVRAPSLPSTTPRIATSPLTGFQGSSDSLADQKTPKEKHASLSITSQAAKTFSPDTAARHSTKFVRRTSAMRKQVGAGDLAMSSLPAHEENGGAYFRSPMGHGLPRMDTWRGRLPTSTQDLSTIGGVSMAELGDGEAEDLELREAVLLSIARSIGLSHNSEGHYDSMGRSSFAPSVSAVSTPNSPMFPHNHAGSTSTRSRAPFANVLDMMNSSSHDENIIGGMLREAVLHAQDDEMSSVSASMADTSADGHKTILRDLEGNVEIMFFKQGTKLVKEGEKSPGIYYVIDGFLDVSVVSPSRKQIELTPGVDPASQRWRRIAIAR